MSTMLLASLLAAPVAFAAPPAANLGVTVTVPSGHEAYESQNIRVVVANTGNRNADGVVLTIQLPETNTSPTVHVMGILGTFDSRCARVGTKLRCTLGQIVKARNTTVAFNLALPWSSEPAVIDASATTTSTETTPANNRDIETAQVNYVDTEIVGPRSATNQHCTGTDLTGFYECTLFPSSISSHDVVFESDGTISFVPDQPGYTGEWEQVGDELWFTYSDEVGVVAEFIGNGVGGDCFEGLTMFFPVSPYMSAYEVCLN